MGLSKSGISQWTCSAIAFLLISIAVSNAEDRRLNVTFGAKGVEQVAYQGVVLEDINRYPGDVLHIWHMKMTDTKGVPLTTGQNGWGENKVSRVWDAGSRSWTYSFTWGSIMIRFVPEDTSLGIEVTEINKPGSGVILKGAAIYALAIHFPKLPGGFSNPTYPQLDDGVSGPSVLAADYGSGLMAIVAADDQRPIYSGLIPDHPAGTYSVVISSTDPPGLAAFAPHHDRPVGPGESDHFKVSLNFAPSGSSLASIAADSYRAWSNSWPLKLRWNDRRMVGTAYLASSAQGDATKPGGYANNPRRYFNDAKADDFDVNTEQGLGKFQQRIMSQALAITENLKRMDAQGVITWDIEGEEYPQQTSYVCSPDQVAALSPEMESTIKDRGSKYAGVKLADAYFKIIHDAGFRVGVCVRPQHFSRNKDRSASQQYLPADQIAAELIRKMRYAHDRWGATLFYLDSTVSADGAVLDASILEKAAAAFPDSLVIPEESNTRSYAYAAPFHDFLFHGRTGTEAAVKAVYPKAFSAVMVNDTDPQRLAASQPDLVKAVAQGDILMVHADYWHPDNATVMKIYSDGRRTH